MAVSDKRARPADADQAVVPLLEDELRIVTKERVTGRVRISTETEEVEELVRQELDGEVVEVERLRIDRMLEAGTERPQIRSEGEVTIVPVLEEILVVEKRLVLKEELRITRRRTREIAEVPVTLRKQRAVVERLDMTTNQNEENENDL